MHGQGTLTSSKGWSFTGALARNRPTAGVLTEASRRRFAVTYAADCKTIQNAPTPAMRACVCACACARGLLPTGASACTVVLSLTLSRFLSLVPSLYRCLSLSLPLSVCLSCCSAHAHSLSFSFSPSLSVSPFPFTSVCHPIPLAVTVSHSISSSLALSSCSCSCILSLFRSFSRSISLSHMKMDRFADDDFIAFVRNAGKWWNCRKQI